MRRKWDQDHWNRRDIRYVSLDGPERERYENDPTPTIIAHRSSYSEHWAFNKISRITTDAGLQNLVERRRHHQAAIEANNYWPVVHSRVHTLGKNVTGKWIGPYGGKKGTYTIAPSYDGEGLMLSARDDLETVVDDELLLFYAKSQRRHFFQMRLVKRSEELLTIAARDRLPALPQKQRFPVKKFGRAAIFGVELLFTAENSYVKTGGRTGHYDHFWKLFYISETADTEIFEIE